MARRRKPHNSTKESKPPKKKEILVFVTFRDDKCADCGTDLWKGNFIRMEGDKPLCLSCADLDHLAFLPSGDAALTRRASKHSKLRAVVLKFSRARRRQERQGILVEEQAIERAEEECLADADVRERRREREHERRGRLDATYVKEFARCVKERYPGCPADEETIIAERACQKYSGRVGRSEAAKQFSPEAIDLAVVAHVRHNHTDYDRSLGSGWERAEARTAIHADLDKVLSRWRK